MMMMMMAMFSTTHPLNSGGFNISIVHKHINHVCTSMFY